MIVDGLIGNGSVETVVNLAPFVVSMATPLHASLFSILYVSKSHVNGGFTGTAVI
jgi:hypothetical protein